MPDTNPYYPAFLDLRNKLCVVVGGGVIALRKVEMLANCGAEILVIAPEIIPEIAAFENVLCAAKPYAATDIEGVWLVIAATDDADINRAVSADAQAARIFCNVVDQPELCSFIVPAVVERGPIKIAISTGGLSPALSKRLRLDIGAFVGEEYEIMARLLGRIRTLVKAMEGGYAEHGRVFDVLVNSDLLSAIKDNDRAQVEAMLAEALGGDAIDLEGIL